KLAGQFTGHFGDPDPELFGPAGQHRRGQAGGQVALDVGAEGVVETEVAVEFLGDALIHDEHREQQGQVWGDHQVVAANDVQDLRDGRPDRHVADGVTAVAG